MSETGDSSNNYENGGRISGDQIKALQILIQELCSTKERCF